MGKKGQRKYVKAHISIKNRVDDIKWLAVKEFQNKLPVRLSYQTKNYADKS
jgi:hypothetical protein